MVYKYSGAIDSKTNELTAKNCTGQVQLKRGDFRAEAMALSNQEIAYQHERKAFVPRNGELYSVFDEKLMDMAARLTKDTLLFCEDGGYQGKKIMNDEPVEKFGQMRLSMSVPKGNALSGQPSLTMLSTKDSKSYAAKMLAYDNLLSKDFPKFERDYYGMRFELVGVLPKNEVCQPLLKLVYISSRSKPKLQCTIHEIFHFLMVINAGGIGNTVTFPIVFFLIMERIAVLTHHREYFVMHFLFIH
jgi:hypothetical protein